MNSDNFKQWMDLCKSCDFLLVEGKRQAVLTAIIYLPGEELHVTGNVGSIGG